MVARRSPLRRSKPWWHSLVHPKTVNGAKRRIALQLRHQLQETHKSISNIIGESKTWCENVERLVWKWDSFDSPQRGPTAGSIARMKNIKETYKSFEAPPLLSEFISQFRGDYNDYCCERTILNCLAKINVKLKKAKNVTNATNPKTCLQRVQKAKAVLDILEDDDPNKVVLFIDEASNNQVKIQQARYLTRKGHNAYRENWNSAVTASATLQFCLTASGEYVHHNFLTGGCRFDNVLSFIEECVSNYPANTPITIVLDNAPSHIKMIKHAQALRNVTFQTLPPCTPDSNLVEYAFSSWKAFFKRDLTTKNYGTMKPGIWLQHCKATFVNWKDQFRLSIGVFDYLSNYLQNLIEAEGNLEILDGILHQGSDNDTGSDDSDESD